MPTCPIPRELVSHAAASRAALQCPLQPLFARRAHLLRAAAERLQPMRDDVEVLVLVEGIERDPQSEALGERNLFLYLDEAQALLAVLVEQALHDRRLAGAARAGQKHVVGGLAVDKLPRILLDALDLPVDAAQVGEPDPVHVLHRLQPAGRAAAAARAPAIRDARRPIGRRGRRGQELLEALENLL